jgi:hypothetical protein
MVCPVALVGQWGRIEQELPERWREAQLVLTVPDDAACARAAAVLGPAGAGRSGNTIRFRAARGGGGVSAEGIRRLLRRLDAERVDGELTLVGAAEAEPPAEAERPALAAAWDAETARLPEDWSDAYAQLDFVSSDQLERAALLLAPVNPSRHDDSPSLRFRVARVFGYGASSGMTRRCLERLDEERIRGSVRILRVLSDTDPVGTQGPVWYVGGRAV